MTGFDLKAYLTARVRQVDEALERVLPPDSVQPPSLHRAMRYSVQAGGKRLRPVLVIAGAEAVGGTAEQVMETACALEFIHTYSLIHDDLPAMDDDDLRRGRPTVHKAFDDATAILAGDALLTLAFGHLADHGTGGNDALAARLVVELAAGAGTGGMVGGQMADIEGETAGLNELAIARMQAMKTGALIRASVRMGALLGGADTDALGHLTAYAEAAGRAFQLADDLLDVTASTAAMGKTTGKDAGAGKQTLVARIGIDAARRHLGTIVHDAITALTPFGAEADILREGARYFATREN
jgi:farnesyl diphosphate synthase